MAAASVAYQPLPWGVPANLALGVAIGAAIIFLETRIRAVSAKQVAVGFLGALVGVLFALIVSIPLGKIPMAGDTQAFWQSLVLLLFIYVGLMLGWKKGERNQDGRPLSSEAPSVAPTVPHPRVQPHR